MYFSGLNLSAKLLTDDTYFQFFLSIYILELNICFSKKCDHQGIYLNFSIFNVNFDFNQYDIRHWDYELDDYEKVVEQ